MEKKTLRDYLPPEFFIEFTDSNAAKYLDVEVEAEYCAFNEDYAFSKWQGTHKNVNCWWKLTNGYSVGWNENLVRGWSFPVIKNNP